MAGEKRIVIEDVGIIDTRYERLPVDDVFSQADKRDRRKQAYLCRGLATWYFTTTDSFCGFKQGTT
jgi:hypothetical protein